MESLLGQFYTRIKGSQEDIASEGLTYVLQRSSAAKEALGKIIKIDCGLIFNDINYSTQNVGEKLERPDISGIDENGKEVIILEAKFWASLTENQPVEYLRRLGDNSVLIFIVPTLRVRPVFNELQIRLVSAQINFVPDNINYSFTLNNNRTLIVKTWNEVLQTIRLHLVQAHEQALLSDLDQIIGLCETIDNSSFQPYQSEDFAPSIAKKINSYYHIVDKVFDELVKRGEVSTTTQKNQSTRTANRKYAYSKNFVMRDLGIDLCVHLDLWQRFADTPIWLSFFDEHCKQPEFRKKFKDVAAKNSIIPYEYGKPRLYVPISLYSLIDKTEDVVIKDIADRIVKLTDELVVEGQ